MNRETILLIHSLLGVIIFILGFLQIILRKGGLIHTYMGKAYLYFWFFLLITGAYLGGLIITIVGVFGLYFAVTGSRISQFKNKEPNIFDRIMFTCSSIVSVIMLYYSIRLYLDNDISFAIIFFVFGCLFLMTGIQDFQKYVLQKEQKKQVYGNMDWYFEHLTRMSISFIAAVTAFISIQNVFKNNVLNFLLPTIIGIILIHRAKLMYAKKFSILKK